MDDDRKHDDDDGDERTAPGEKVQEAMPEPGERPTPLRDVDDERSDDG